MVSESKKVGMMIDLAACASMFTFVKECNKEEQDVFWDIIEDRLDKQFPREEVTEFLFEIRRSFDALAKAFRGE